MEKGTVLNSIQAFAQYLREEERERGTIEKYLCDIRLFAAWTGERALDKALIATWKEHLKIQGYKPETINGKLSALNKFLRFIEREAQHLESRRHSRPHVPAQSHHLSHNTYNQNVFLRTPAG